MGEVVEWIKDRLPFDRIYFYGNDKPIHVSYSRSPKSEIVDMLVQEKTGKLVPRVRR
jgi:hypothetical protein